MTSKQARCALADIIRFYQNDFRNDGGYFEKRLQIDKGKMKIILLELIMNMSRLVNDIRYCSMTTCSCSPEQNIVKAIEQNRQVLYNMLKTEGGALRFFDKICEENNARKTEDN